MEEKTKIQRRPIAGPGVPMTQEQIAKATGVTRSMIYLIEKRAMLKIRKELLKSGFDMERDV
jgi:DNA-directed RNA polymerase sigma subunit (sigma70/sigma32)